MKIKNISKYFFLIPFIFLSCLPVTVGVPTETIKPTLSLPANFTSTPTVYIAPTYAYLPTFTPIPSSTPFLITPSASQELTSQFSQSTYGNAFTVTIKEEKFFLESYRYPIYQVLLNFNNFSGKEITDVAFYLVTYKGKDFKVFPDIYSYADFAISELGYDSDNHAIPIGESNFLIDINIYLNRNYTLCTDGSLDKPLYLILFVGLLNNTDNPLVTSSDLNQRIREVPCTYS